MNIDKRVAQQLAENRPVEGFETVVNEIVDHSRWSIEFQLVVRKDGRFYQAFYSEGATETQDEAPFEYEDDPVVFAEVVPIEKTVTVYEPRKEQAPVDSPAEERP